ncbi:MAG TPA: hypothetical protein DCM68_02230 [Verrucomicrobia bacterium]|nr:hypothetical protein [Verrucomicrobiota bacterium]
MVSLIGTAIICRYANTLGAIKPSRSSIVTCPKPRPATWVERFSPMNAAASANRASFSRSSGFQAAQAAQPPMVFARRKGQ